jgi:hypothetical protein
MVGDETIELLPDALSPMYVSQILRNHCRSLLFAKYPGRAKSAFRTTYCSSWFSSSDDAGRVERNVLGAPQNNRPKAVTRRARRGVYGSKGTSKLQRRLERRGD